MKPELGDITSQENREKVVMAEGRRREEWSNGGVMAEVGGREERGGERRRDPKKWIRDKR